MVYQELRDFEEEKKSIVGNRARAKAAFNLLLKLLDKPDFEKNKEKIFVYLLSASPLTFNILKGAKDLEKDEIKRLLELAIKYLETTPKIIAKRIKELIEEDSTLIVHPISSVVIATLKEAKEKIREVFVPECRPFNKGEDIARELREAEVNAILIADTAVNYFMASADLVLLGADAYTPWGLVNYVGTSQIAIIAQEHNVPVIAGFELLKHKESLLVEEGEASELSNLVPARNPRFDLTLYSHVSWIVNELGEVKKSGSEVFEIGKKATSDVLGYLEKYNKAWFGENL